MWIYELWCLNDIFLVQICPRHVDPRVNSYSTHFSGLCAQHNNSQAQLLIQCCSQCWHLLVSLKRQSKDETVHKTFSTAKMQTQKRNVNLDSSFTNNKLVLWKRALCTCSTSEIPVVRQTEFISLYNSHIDCEEFNQQSYFLIFLSNCWRMMKRITIPLLCLFLKRLQPG